METMQEVDFFFKKGKNYHQYPQRSERRHSIHKTKIECKKEKKERTKKQHIENKVL